MSGEDNAPRWRMPEPEDPRLSRAFAITLLLLGAAAGLLPYLGGSNGNLSLPARVPALLPTAYLWILGVRCWLQRSDACAAAKVTLTTAITILAAFAMTFALLAALQQRGVDFMADIPVFTIGVFAIVAATMAITLGAMVRSAARLFRRRDASGRGERPPAPFMAILGAAASFFLFFDAMSAGNMEQFVENSWQMARADAVSARRAEEREAARAPQRLPASPPPPAAAPPKAAPGTPQFPAATGRPLALGDSGKALWVDGMTSQRWNPGSNQLGAKVQLPFVPESAVETKQGIVFLASRSVALATPDGKVYSADLLVTRSRQSLVGLADGSALVLGGIVSVAANGTKLRTNAVERVTLGMGGTLSVERMPDLPGAVRTAFSTVALADGRAMVLGGTDSPYVGCSPCTAETWILDPARKSWQAGPKMNEPRSDMSATLLPDGGVLVAGGWTPKHVWGGAGSRTVERWNPRQNAFVPLPAMMTSYMSMHRALWLPGEEGKQLVLAGGNSAAIQVYDVAHDIWRVAGETCQGTENQPRRDVIPVQRDGQYALILQNGTLCPGENAPWSLVPLRLPIGGPDMKSTARSFSGDGGIALYRDVSYLPGQGDGLALALGGTIHAGMNNYVITAAVDALWPDGHIQSMPGFLYARAGARVFRLQDGAVLLVGGRTNVGGYDHAVEQVSAAEWLPGNLAPEEARWQPLEAGWAHGEALGQMANGSLLAVSEEGEVSRITISADVAGKPQAQSSDLPPLPEPRLFQDRTALIVRGLPDGRIIVAGGEMQNKRLAVMGEDAMVPDAKDDYLRIGDSEATGDYDIYEPASGTWRVSAPSRARGGLVAVHDDGRVVRLTAKEKPDNEPGPSPQDPELEISRADGKSWRAFRAEELPAIGMKSGTNLFVLQDELFIAGELLHSDIEALQWFNSATRRWETLWQAAPEQNWRNNVGRIIIRTLANGKRVMLPVAGI